MQALELQSYFRDLSKQIFNGLRASEVLLVNFEAEHSDFVRLNRNKIRQAGHVAQHYLQLVLVANKRQCGASFTLSGNLQADLQQSHSVLSQLREQLLHLPEDPHIDIALEPHDTVHRGADRLPPVQETIQRVIDYVGDLDLVGAWASGAMMHGFANSYGQFNWHSNHNFNFDWSIFLENDKAFKQNYAGFEWDEASFQQKIAYARQSLDLLARPAKTIKPGRYRVFLAPEALQEIMGLLNQGGFGLKSHRTLQTPLIKMINDGVQLNPVVNITENHRQGLAPIFTKEGFIKPDSVTLVENGVYQQCLANARSAKEYNTAVNCSIEHPQTLQLGGGKLHQNKILQTLDTGVFISNLWYGNYSDRNHCRITGMTRFACLWVENGVPVAPLNVMRFDESLYHILGDRLIDLTEEHEQLFNSLSYQRRSENCAYLPGALVEDFTFTL